LYLEAEGKRGPSTEFDDTFIQHRQGTRQAETDRTCIRIWLAAKLCATAAKDLGFRRQLGMDLHADNCFPTFFHNKKTRTI
jgi:hypothetical protein